MHRCDFDQTSELQSQSKTVSNENQAKNVQNPFLVNNIRVGTLLPQGIPGGTGTRPKVGEAHELNSFFKLFVAVRFRLRLTGGVDSAPHTSLFLCTMRVLNDVLHNTLAQVSVKGMYLAPHIHEHLATAY